MQRRNFLIGTASAGAGLMLSSTLARACDHTDPVTVPGVQQLPGVWKLRFGSPEAITPVQTRHYAESRPGFARLPQVSECPVQVTAQISARGCLLHIPLASNEAVYGLGLQLMSFLQRGSKKKLRINADPKMDTGDSHAPVPFYVTSRGYGVFIDTARYAQFYCGNSKRKGARSTELKEGQSVAESDLPLAYKKAGLSEPSEVMVEVPEAQGVDVYVFGGPTMRHAIMRYNLFSGGGALPPRWGLGVWYRAEKAASHDDVTKLAAEFRERQIPCDVIGLEPGWQSHAYSCTFKWSPQLFPNPAETVGQLRSANYHVNLWEHAFTHPDSPIHQALEPHSGDYLVWGGLVPDFLAREARETFADYHEKQHLALGVSGYKLDECDNSDFTGGWSFPEVSRFPSGADGEQMHSLFGLRYQDAIQHAFEKRKQRTYGLVRSSQALAAPYPYVLYSDLYDHRQFIRALANSGFSGLLWTPELRNAQNTEDLIRRLQSVVLSPLALINGWYIKNPPWKQVDRKKNNDGELQPGWEQVEAQCREVLKLRMRMIPYLHAAFVRYSKEGLPPFRALVADYPEDRGTWSVDDQYMMGDSLMIAPAFAGQSSRSVYLPEGQWFDFWTDKPFAGRQTVSVDVPLDRIPIFVKSGTILPLAEPTLHTEDPSSWMLEARVYGPDSASARLYEDDGSFEPRLDEVTLQWDANRSAGRLVVAGGARTRYQVKRWTPIRG